MTTNIVIGAGVSGLSFLDFSNATNILFEKESTIGGLCKSIKSNGFIFDYSGHFIHIKDKKIKKYLENLLQEKMLCVKRNAYIFFNDKFMPYPFQANLYYLNNKQKQQCIDGIKNRINKKIYDDMPFIDWCNCMFGSGITKYFMKPYNKKLWNYDLKKLTASWTAPFVPKPNIKTIIKTAYTQNKMSYGYNSKFYYPKYGCGTIVESLYKKNKASVMLNSQVKRIDWKNKNICVNKKKYCYDNLISTQPLDKLLDSLTNIPSNIKKLRKQLISTSIKCINIGIEYKSEIPSAIKDKHWIYFPQDKYPFYRLGIYSNVSNKLVPKKSYSLYVELSYNKNKYNTNSIISILKNMGIISRNDKVKTINVVDIPCAYVIFNKSRKIILSKINKFLNDNKIYCLGRYGNWEYSFIEKNIIDAKILAKKLK